MSMSVRASLPIVVSRAVQAPTPDAPPLIVKPQPGTKPAPAASAKPQVGLLKRLSDGFNWLVYGPRDATFKTREVVRDPLTPAAIAKEKTAAQAHLAASAAQETAAIAKLGPRAASYQKLAALCGDDVIARDALLRSLLEGRLTGSKDLKGEADALTYLMRMATQALPAGLDRKALITNVIKETDDPTKLSQEAKGTCVASTATVVLLRKSPVEYMRLIQGLATLQGEVKTVNGTKLVRNSDWANPNDGGRTPSVRLLQPALMDVGNFFMKYDNNQDNHVLSNGGAWHLIQSGFDRVFKGFHLPGGLGPFGSNKVLEALTGDNYHTEFNITRLNREHEWREVEAKLKQGKSVPCGLHWEGGGHEVLLDKIEGGFCYFNNPWGETDRMSVEEFKRNLHAVNLPPG